MRRFLLLLVLTATLCGAAERDRLRPELTREEIEGRYATARAALEDETVTEIAHVPAMLSTCARQGHGAAARLLLDVYEGKFKGLEPRPADAADLARGIAENPVPFPDDPDCAAMHIEGMFRLALYLERGYGCTKNVAEAYRWMTRAADAGMPQAQVERARMMALGKGTPRDMKGAWAILRSVAETAPNTPHVFFYMGYICYCSHTAAGRRRAAELFYIGARHRDADCMNNLGAMYEGGVAVRQNSAKALTLYTKAETLGHKQASANRQRLLYKEGHQQEETSAGTRISNAAQRVIRMLPINDKSKGRLWQWLSGHPHT